MRKIRQVLRLALEQGASYRRIEESIGVGRDAIDSYVKRFKAAGLSWPLDELLDDAGLEARLFPSTHAIRSERPMPDFGLVHIEMREKGKGATIKAQHEKYLEENPDGLKLSRFTELYGRYVAKIDVYLRHTHVAGAQTQVDFTGSTLKIYLPDSEQPRKAQIFVGVLPASQYIYGEAIWSQTIPDWIAAHVRMFENFGGVTDVVVCDNLKSGVTKAHLREPVINAIYQNFADHYDTMVVPARAYTPRDKGSVENSVLIVTRKVLYKLRHRKFTSLEEANSAVQDEVKKLNSAKFAKFDATRQGLLDSIDRPALRPLPMTPFEYAEFRRVRIGLNYQFEHEGQWYSVPHTLAREEVDLRITLRVIEVSFNGRRVCTHQRVTIPGDPKVLPEHQPPSHRYISDFSDERAFEWAESIGQSTKALLIASFKSLRSREQKYRFMGSMKKLAEQYGQSVLDAACIHALEIGAFRIEHINSILVNRNHKADEGQEADFTHKNIRGGKEYE